MAHEVATVPKGNPFGPLVRVADYTDKWTRVGFVGPSLPPQHAPSSMLRRDLAAHHSDSRDSECIPRQ